MMTRIIDITEPTTETAVEIAKRIFTQSGEPLRLTHGFWNGFSLSPKPPYEINIGAEPLVAKDLTNARLTELAELFKILSSSIEGYDIRLDGIQKVLNDAIQISADCDPRSQNEIDSDIKDKRSELERNQAMLEFLQTPEGQESWKKRTYNAIRNFERRVPPDDASLERDLNGYIGRLQRAIKEIEANQTKEAPQTCDNVIPEAAAQKLEGIQELLAMPADDIVKINEIRTQMEGTSEETIALTNKMKLSPEQMESMSRIIDFKLGVEERFEQNGDRFPLWWSPEIAIVANLKEDLAGELTAPLFANSPRAAETFIGKTDDIKR